MDSRLTVTNKSCTHQLLCMLNVWKMIRFTWNKYGKVLKIALIPNLKSDFENMNVAPSYKRVNSEVEMKVWSRLALFRQTNLCIWVIWGGESEFRGLRSWKSKLRLCHAFKLRRFAQLQGQMQVWSRLALFRRTNLCTGVIWGGESEKRTPSVSRWQ